MHISSPTPRKRKTQWSKHKKKECVSICVQVTLCLIIVGLVICLVSLNRAAAAVSCDTIDCVVSAVEVIKFLNLSVNPCDDFFKFVCSNIYTGTYGDAANESPFDLISDQVKEQIYTILNEPINPQEHYLLQNYKLIVNSCANDSGVLESGISSFLDVIQELGGWPLVDENWNNEADWVILTQKLRNLGLDHDIFFYFEIQRDEKIDGMQILELGEPQLDVLDERFMKQYIETVQKIVYLFGANVTTVTEDIKDIMRFRFELAKITNKTKSVPKVNRMKRMAIFQVQELYNNHNINWLQFINAILLPRTQLTEQDFILFPNTIYVEQLLTLLESTPKRIQVNYLIWSGLEEMLMFFIKVVEDYDEAKPGQQEKHVRQRMSQCQHIADNIMPFIIDILYARRFLPKEKLMRVEELVKNIKLAFKQLLKENGWMDHESREYAIEKIDAMTVYIGAPDYLDNTILDELMLDKESFENQEFFTMQRKAYRSSYDIYLGHLRLNVDATRSYGYYKYTRDASAYYAKESNTMMLPAALLQDGLFNLRRPQSLNYGVIGSIIGHEMIHGFGSKEASHYGKFGSHRWWTNQTERAFDRKSACFVNQVEDFQLHSTSVKMDGNKTLEENIADFTGVKLSHMAYEYWVQENGIERKLPGLQFSSNQLFWIGAASFQCSNVPIEKIAKLVALDKHAVPEYRVVGPLSNHPRFADDFNCPKGSKMNPGIKCQMF